jgi:hypothetical protein
VEISISSAAKERSCRSLSVGTRRLQQSFKIRAQREILPVHDIVSLSGAKPPLLEKLKARGGFAGEDRAELLHVERMLRTFAATEK